MSKPTIPDELDKELRDILLKYSHLPLKTDYRKAHKKLTKLISKREIEARKAELKRFLEYEVLTHQGGLQRARSVSVKKIEKRLNQLTELQEGKK